MVHRIKEVHAHTACASQGSKVRSEVCAEAQDSVPVRSHSILFP
jgi:hypothetical protein